MDNRVLIDQLYNDYEKLITKTLKSYIDNAIAYILRTYPQANRDDCVQEMMLYLIEQKIIIQNDYNKGKSAVQTYISMKVQYKCRDYLRRNYMNRITIDAGEVEIADRDEAIEDSFTKVQIFDVVCRIIDAFIKLLRITQQNRFRSILIAKYKKRPILVSDILLSETDRSLKTDIINALNQSDDFSDLELFVIIQPLIKIEADSIRRDYDNQLNALAAVLNSELDAVPQAWKARKLSPQLAVVLKHKLDVELTQSGIHLRFTRDNIENVLRYYINYYTPRCQ